MDESSSAGVLNELHTDLIGRYKLHKDNIDAIWRSFDRAQRAKCMKAGAYESVVLKHPNDISLGSVYKFMPEWNLRSITEQGPEAFLDVLKHRATQSLHEQYCNGVRGEPGDHEFIVASMKRTGLAHVNPYKRCFTQFMDDRYGQSFEVAPEALRDVITNLRPAMEAGLIIPQSIGELIIQRQTYLIQSLNIMIEDILDQGSKSRDRKPRPKRVDTDAVGSIGISSLSMSDESAKCSLPELILNTFDRRASIEDYTSLIVTEAAVLAYEVNHWFYTRPELLPDEKGRRLPMTGDKYISAAVFAVVQNSANTTAIWGYMSGLLELLEGPDKDKTHRAIILQEIANICHLEYNRSQNVLTRFVKSRLGSKWFHRNSNAKDSGGDSRVVMNDDPEKLTRTDPQLHYLLRLCQAQTTPLKAVQWLEKLDSLHKQYPTEREKISERELDALFDLTMIVAFMKDLSAVTSLPPFSRKKSDTFRFRAENIEANLKPLRTEIDLSEFVTPIDHLLEPGMSRKALELLDQSVSEKAGKSIRLLYQELVQECLANVQTQYQQVKDKTSLKDTSDFGLPVAELERLEDEPEQRKQKTKTRALHPTADPTSQSSSEQAIEVQPQSQVLKVRPSVAEVFSNLFAKSESRSPVGWMSFQRAMSAIGFSIIPKYGSVYTFVPPVSMEGKRPLTLHRPHKSQIEGHRILILARRLQRLYGWDEQTFTVISV